MAALTKMVPRLITALNTRNGLAGVLQRLFGGQGIKGSGIVGKTTITNGNTSVTVSDTGVQTGDLFFVSILAKGSNAVSFVGVSNIVANTSYDLNVSGDPGAAGVTLAVIRLPAQLLFAS